MAPEVSEPSLPQPRGADPLQLGDGAAAAGEAALGLQVTILSCPVSAMPRLSAYRDKFFLNGAAKYEQDKVQRWYNWYGRNIIQNYRSGMVL